MGAPHVKCTSWVLILSKASAPRDRVDFATHQSAAGVPVTGQDTNSPEFQKVVFG